MVEYISQAKQKRGENRMANIKSSQKRIDVAKRNTLRNKSRKSEIKTYIKKFEALVEAGNLEEARDRKSVV